MLFKCHAGITLAHLCPTRKFRRPTVRLRRNWIVGDNVSAQIFEQPSPVAATSANLN
jgi:hypothetical protein